jgi:prepilin-type N-terminal cleavage/methylation domain-containing protein
MVEVARRGIPERGFSLLEVLLALSITLVVMLLVIQTMGHLGRVYRRETDLASSSAAASLALDDIQYELSLAGQGLGDGPASVLPRIRDAKPSDSTLTVRSNPNVDAGLLQSDLLAPGQDLAVAPSEGFREGDNVLVTDAAGFGETAEVLRADPMGVALRSLETGDGSFRRAFSPGRGARVLGLREVRYFLEAPREDGTRDLIKEVLGENLRVLTRDVLSLSFEYRDPDDAAISLAKVESSREVASVRVTLRYASGKRTAPAALTTRVALAPRSGTVDFEKRELGFRLSRVFYPIDHPTGAASRIGADWAVILASGKRPTHDAAYLYSFPLEREFLGAGVDEILPLEDVRAPIGLAFGPESGPLAGTLFVAAWGLRIGHLARIAPNAEGRLSSGSLVTTFEGTEAIAQAGGIAFGADDALYIASRERGAIYRFRFDARGTPGKPELVSRLAGTPGAIAEGTDGHLYFLMSLGNRCSLWKVAFDENLEPAAPVMVGPLPGDGISLARDPVGRDLFALVRTGAGDSVVMVLGRSFLRGVTGEAGAPTPQFSLRDWVSRLEEGKVGPREIPFSISEIPEKLAFLRLEELDSLSFDAFGSLYLGNREKDVLLKFELDRPSGRYAVGLAAGLVERGEGLSPIIRMHAWKKSGLGF